MYVWEITTSVVPDGVLAPSGSDGPPSHVNRWWLTTDRLLNGMGVQVGGLAIKEPLFQAQRM